MTEKDLKKLNRYQLLEMLIVQTERADQLQARLEETQRKLEDQEIKIATLGSIAEASLQITGVIEAAQKAADLYVNSARKYAKDIEDAAYEEAANILAQARIARNDERTEESTDEETQ